MFNLSTLWNFAVLKHFLNYLFDIIVTVLLTKCRDMEYVQIIKDETIYTRMTLIMLIYIIFEDEIVSIRIS